MKFLKVKDNQDFVFKLVTLITLIFTAYFFIYCLNNYEYLFPFREGLDIGEGLVVKEVKTDEEEQKEEEEKEEEEKEKEEEEKKEFNSLSSGKSDVINNVNSALSYENNNRDETLEKIDSYKQYNKAQIINLILNGATSKGNVSYELKTRFDINQYFKTDLDAIISGFPLTESQNSSMDTGSMF